jgi:hypothetical protein
MLVPCAVAQTPLRTDAVAAFPDRSAVPPAAGGKDATLEFAAENRPAADSSKPASARTWMIAVTLAVVTVTVAAAGAVWVWPDSIGVTGAASGGSLRVESDPPGAEVRLNGEVRGTTPVSLSVPVGSYTLAVHQGSNVKQLPVEIAKGVRRDFHVSFPAVAPPVVAATVGGLHVTSDSPDSVVSVDGVERGRAPLTLRDLAAGRHEVVVRTAGNTFRRTVQVDPGATASLVIGGTAAASTSWGWISLKSSFVIQVLEGGRLIGTSEIDRIMLPPGNHDLEFLSEPFGLRAASRVTVRAGQAAAVSVNIPEVPMNINAIPWAEVFVNNARIGDTPLANVTLPLGEHVLVFRHPQFGEKRQTVRVTLNESLRISVDMRSR